MCGSADPTPQDPIAGTHRCSNGDGAIGNLDLIAGGFSLTFRNSRDRSQDPTFPSGL